MDTFIYCSKLLNTLYLVKTNVHNGTHMIMMSYLWGRVSITHHKSRVVHRPTKLETLSPDACCAKLRLRLDNNGKRTRGGSSGSRVYSLTRRETADSAAFAVAMATTTLSLSRCPPLLFSLKLLFNGFFDYEYIFFCGIFLL